MQMKVSDVKYAKKLEHAKITRILKNRLSCKKEKGGRNVNRPKEVQDENSKLLSQRKTMGISVMVMMPLYHLIPFMTLSTT